MPDAIALLESDGAPDVVLADIGMPGEDGYAFLEAMRSLHGKMSSVPVIAVTAYAGAENEARALAAGFKMHCSKPLDPDTVARAVLKIVGKADATNARRVKETRDKPDLKVGPALGHPTDQ